MLTRLGQDGTNMANWFKLMEVLITGSAVTEDIVSLLSLMMRPAELWWRASTKLRQLKTIWTWSMIMFWSMVYQWPCTVIGTKYSPSTTKRITSPIQFQRALEILGIQGILISSPQAKGRIERLNKTLQNRWVKAFEFHKVHCLEQANALVPQLIKAHNWNSALFPVIQIMLMSLTRRRSNC